jgi:hypothetical protein
MALAWTDWVAGKVVHNTKQKVTIITRFIQTPPSVGWSRCWKRGSLFLYSRAFIPFGFFRLLEGMNSEGNGLP